jgi:glycerophosphoryl diester phosphodiesterase
VLGHRGASAHEPENTLKSYHRALTDGADGIEIDVRMTTDGVLVISHDDEVPLADGAPPARISRLSYSQIKDLRTASGEPVPTLRRVLLFQAETGSMINVELKSDVIAPAWMTKKAISEVATHGGDRIVFSSFSPFMVRTTARALPHISSALLLEPDQWLLAKVMPLSLCLARGVHPHRSLVTAAFVERARRLSAFVGCYTVNDPDEAGRLAALGVDVLISDDPARILKALRAT